MQTTTQNKAWQCINCDRVQTAAKHFFRIAPGEGEFEGPVCASCMGCEDCDCDGSEAVVMVEAKKEPRSRLSEACQHLSTKALELEAAGYRRAEALARLQQATAANDIILAQAAADLLTEVINAYHVKAMEFVRALDACRVAWETRKEDA